MKLTATSTVDTPGTVGRVPLAERLYPVNRGDGRTDSLGASHSEAKLFEEMGRTIPDNAKGEIYIYSERPVCGGYQVTAEMFMKDHPGIKVVFVSPSSPVLSPNKNFTPGR